MNDCSAPAANDHSHTAEKLKGLDIHLPDAPGFISRPRKPSLATAVALNEALLASVNSRPGEMERRRQDRATVPFEL
jgi:hypothetical protein